jgi:YQGE family putative transporter
MSELRIRFTKNVRQLFFSNSLQIASDALLSVFIAAFIWRITGSLVAVALYSIGQFALQPFVFWLNGLLLRRWNIRHLLVFGAGFSGLAELGVVFLAGFTNPFLFLLAGIVRALGHGFYWPNRNYLEFQEIKDGARNYFFSLIQIVSWVAQTVLPFIVGWLIVFGPRAHQYSFERAYWVLFGLAFFLMLFSGLALLGGKFKSPKPTCIQRFTLQKFWNERRVLGFARGVVAGTSFVASILVLKFLGNEGVLGTITALAAFGASLLIYAYGRFLNSHHRYQATLIATLGFVATAIALIVLPMPLGPLVFVLLSGITADSFGVATEPIFRANADREMNGDEGIRFSFVFDNEFFLNFGRVVGITLVIMIAFFGSMTTALFYSPLLVGVIQLILVLIILSSRLKK